MTFSPYDRTDRLITELKGHLKSGPGTFRPWYESLPPVEREFVDATMRAWLDECAAVTNAVSAYMKEVLGPALAKFAEQLAVIMAQPDIQAGLAQDAHNSRPKN